MKRYQKILLVTSACLIVGGGIMGVAGLAMGGSPSFIITEKGIQTPEDITEGKFVEKTLPLKGVSSMEISWEEGDIEIVEGDSFHVEYGYDERYIQVKEQAKNGTWYLSSKYNQRFDISGIHFFWNSNVWDEQKGYLKIYVPKGTKLSNLNLVSGYGKVKIDLPKIAAESVKLDLESGNLEMKGLDSQNAELNLEYGNLNLKDCDFTEMTVKNESGACSFSNISAEQANLELDYGDLDMQSCEITNITAANEGGKCSLKEVAAEVLMLEADYGELSLEQVKADKVTLSDESGSIYVYAMEGKSLKVVSEYGKVTLDTVRMDTSIQVEIESETMEMRQVEAGQLDIASGNGSLEGREIEIGTGNLELDYGNCNITEFSVKDLHVSSGSGNITLDLTGKEKDYSMMLKTEYGDIHVNGEDKGTDITLEQDKAENRLDINGEDGKITIKTQ